jgi:hypothetical protein
VARAHAGRVLCGEVSGGVGERAAQDTAPTGGVVT